MHGRNPQHIIAVTGFARCHGLVIAVPVSAAQSLRDDQVKRTAKRLALRKAEHAFGRGVPEGDVAAGIGDDDCVADYVGKLLKVDGSLHGAPPRKDYTSKSNKAPSEAPYVHIRARSPACVKPSNRPDFAQIEDLLLAVDLQSARSQGG